MGKICAPSGTALLAFLSHLENVLPIKIYFWPTNHHLIKVSTHLHGVTGGI